MTGEAARRGRARDDGRRRERVEPSRLGDHVPGVALSSPAAREWLANRGDGLVYGDRPLPRLIQKDVLDELARTDRGGEWRDGAPVAFDAIDGQLTFSPTMSASPLVAERARPSDRPR